jgi:hypothetical protein
MEKITDKIAALPADANYFSLEYFPRHNPYVSGAVKHSRILTFYKGFLQPPNPARAYGTGSSSLVCERYVGSWRLNSDKVS